MKSALPLGPVGRTRSQQRLEQLINAGRPLTEDEQEELYRALHADYMRKWRLVRAEQMEREQGRFVESEKRRHEKALLERVREEARPKWRFRPLKDNPKLGVLVSPDGKPRPAAFLSPEAAKAKESEAMAG